MCTILYEFAIYLFLFTIQGERGVTIKMDIKKSQNGTKNRFLKLSLKKNKEQNAKEANRSSDLIVIDESFDRLTPEYAENMAQKIYSPIVIDDSTDVSADSDLPKFKLPYPEPSKVGNVSFNGSQNDTSICEVKDSRPSMGGCWSPAQGIICATPKQQTIPSTPKDTVNESSEQCSIKKIQHSHKKLLSELYGEIWKSIPTLFKTGSRVDSNNISNCTKKLHFLDDSDMEDDFRTMRKQNRELYLTNSDAKRKVRLDESLSEKKSRKKLYTEIIPSTPEPRRRVKRDANSTTKKLKSKSVTELVHIMKDKFDVDPLTKQVENVCITPVNNKYDKVIDSVKRLSFMGSLADNVPSWRRHPEAYEYLDDFKGTKEKLTRRLFEEFNKNVFHDDLDADMALQWDAKLRTTAGITLNRHIKKADGSRVRLSSIRLSVKVVDGPQRLRDTLIHELCHAATWIIDQELRAGHGPLWKKWAHRAVQVYPELGEISRCHDMEIHFKFTYKCTKCGYTIQRQSKSVDITSKCCGYCRGMFVIFRNKKNKDGVIVSTPARQREASDFALYVKQNYGTLKDGKKTHAQVMKLLGEQFSAKKKNAVDS